jgi:antitoxin HicB
MSEHTYTAVFEPAEDGGYVVTFPAVPNLATQGETLEEARAMAVDCLQGYLEWRMEDGLPLPESEANVQGTIREPVTVTLPSATDADQLEDERELRDPEVERLIEDGTKEYQAGNSRPAEELLAELEREERSANSAADTARARAWEEILRTVDMPKWQGPGPEPSEEEVMQMVVEEIKQMRRERRREGDGGR